MIAVVALAALLGGCGGDADKTGAAALPEASTSASPPGSEQSDPDGSAGSGEKAEKPDGKAFDDPQGEYTLVVGETWKKVKPPKAVQKLPGQKEAEYWTIGKAEKGFTPNINVITQSVPGADLESYKKVSEEGSEKANLEVVSSKIVKNSDGDEIGLIEYTGDPTGSGQTAHFLATYAVSDDKAVVATLSTDASTFKKHRSKIEPLLKTLARTS